MPNSVFSYRNKLVVVVLRGGLCFTGQLYYVSTDDVGDFYKLVMSCCSIYFYSFSVVNIYEVKN